MKILQVHKYLYRKDGADTYMFDVADLLEKRGHEVMFWGTDINVGIDKNIYKDLLVKGIDFSRREGFVKDFMKFMRMIWSVEAKRKFKKVIERFKPDIIHIHNIYHHISPSILSVAKKYKIPVVMNVHDYNIVNPNYTLFDHEKICEKKGIGMLINKCIKNSFIQSLAGLIIFKIHRLMRVYKNGINTYIVPVQFTKNKLISGGIEKEKIKTLLLPLEVGESGSLGNYILFSGRINIEKGIYLLIDIAKKLPKIKFKVAGDGPELQNAINIAKEVNNIEFLKFIKKEKLNTLIKNARLIVVPSLWYENSPYAVLEAMALGKTVVATELGGMKDLIENKKTGFLIKARAEEWVDIIEKIYYNKSLLKNTGDIAKAYIKIHHDPEKHYRKLIEIYQNAKK